MRELTLSELELVSGGTNSGDDGVTELDEVDVVGDRGDSGDWGDYGDYGDDVYYGDYGDYGDAGDSTPGPVTDGEDPDPDCAQDGQVRLALAQFLADAAARGEHLAHRERGYFVIRNDDGSYALTGYSVGPSVFSAEGAQVTPNPAGVTPTNVVGFIHNQPAGGTLSAPDRDLLNIYQNWVWENGGTQEFKMWVITPDEKIKVFDKDNMNDEDGVDVTHCP